MKLKKLIAILIALSVITSFTVMPAAAAGFDAYAQILGGKTIGVNDAFRIQFLTDADILSMPDNAVTVSGLTVTQSYDSASKTITLTPSVALTKGTKYTVNLNITALSGIGMTVKGDTSFFVIARDEYVTDYKKVTDDNFDDGTVCGWASGAGKTTTLTPVTLDSGEKVLKVDFPVITQNPTWVSNNEQSTITKTIGSGIEVTDNNLIKIQTRIKGTNPADLFALKINRPDATSTGVPLYESGYNTYTVAHYSASGISGGAAVGDSNGKVNVYKSLRKIDTLDNGNAFSYDGVDLTGKWVDYTILIDGKTNKMKVVASFEHNGEMVTLSDSNLSFLLATPAYEYEYGTGTDKRTFNAIERITLASVNTVGPQTIYIDSISVENLPKGNVSVSVLPNTVEGIIYKPEFIEIKFESDINYTDGGIIILDENGQTVTHRGNFDESTNIYKAEFSSVLAGGNYSVVINGSVTPVNHFPEADLNKDFSERNIAFEVHNALPPSAKDVYISGRLVPNTSIEACFTYVSEADDEGEHIYEWFFADSIDGEFFPLTNEGGKFLDLDENLCSKYIKVKVTAVSNKGLTGYSDESDIVAPESEPVINNIELSTQVPFAGTNISVLYDYSDENGDVETSSIITWSVSDNAGGPWSDIGEGKNLEVNSSMLGKYIKCSVIPVNDADYKESGGLYETVSQNPVATVEDYVKKSNLLTNAGFEEGIEPYQFGTTSGWKGIEVLSGVGRTGVNALHVYPRNVVYDNWGYPVTFEAGKSYLMGAWVKRNNGRDIKSVFPYFASSGVTKLEDESQSYTDLLLDDKWYLVAGANTSETGVTGRMGPISFVSITICDILVDDMYFGELIVSDIETYNAGTITVPKTEAISVPLTTGKVLNQLGTQNGLWNEKIEIKIPEVQGISVDGNNLVIGTDAVATTFKAEISCKPTFPGAQQKEFKKFVDVTVEAHEDTKPRVYNVDVQGTFGVGNTLTGTYSYHQVNGIESDSKVQWMYSDTLNGSYSPIDGATSLSYTIESKYADKFILMSVTPVTVNGDKGEEVRSKVFTKARQPIAENVELSGVFGVDKTITASYDFLDDNLEDKEAVSEYKWYVGDNENGTFTPITGQNTKTLVLTESMTGKYIKFGVTPVSDSAPQKGEEVLSKAYLGPAVPVVTDVTIRQEGSRIYADYKYSHPHGINENNTKFQWILGGFTVSTDSSYQINFAGAAAVTLSVTPGCDVEPKKGNTVSVTAVIYGTDGFTGGATPSGGGGGGGGGASSGGITNINNMTRQEEATTPAVPKTDIDSHWGKEYIKEMEKRGVMSADENGNFDPDKNVNRQEMLTSLFKALGLEMTEYKNEFTDVADGDFAKMLQTMVDNGTIAKDVSFRPNDTISREEMCKILYVSLKNAGKLAQSEEMIIESFADFNAVSDWAKVYVNSIYTNKIMVGVSDTHFDPQGTVTKAQAATMLTRILSLTEGGETK